ncbi:MAG: mechanosensitive ion channel family protein [Eubacteriales bacterium]|nr:mechanosensitive ion channel family protein [Eubacteriales bacterium]
MGMTGDMHVLEGLLDYAVPAVSTLVLKIVYTVLIVLIGMKLISLIRKWSRNSLIRMHVDEGVGRFLSSCIGVALYGLLIFIAAGALGVNSASIIALLGSAGIAISLALQGSLSNFAGGVLLLLAKPFVVGDYIISQDGEGTVSSIGIIYTTLLTTDNRKIVLPNGALSNSPLINVTAQDKRLVIINVSIEYSADLKRAKETLRTCFSNNPMILAGEGDEAVNVFVDSLADSGVVLSARGYVKTEDYWTAKRALTEETKLALDAAGIGIPYPKLDVSLKQ